MYIASRSKTINNITQHTEEADSKVSSNQALTTFSQKRLKIALLIKGTKVTSLNWAFKTSSSDDWKDLLKWAGVPVLGRTTSSQTSF